MKVFALLLAFWSAGVLADDCSDFPRKNGPIVKNVYVKGLLVTVKANFELDSGVSFGRAYTSHSYESPEFYVDGQRVSVERNSAEEIFKALGYERLSYVVNKQAGLFDRGLLLDSDLRVRKVAYKEIILQDYSPIVAYHPVCSNWQY